MDEPSRRTFVAGAAAAAMAAVTGCSTYGQASNTPPSPGSGSGSGPGSAPANGVLTKVGDVPVGGGVIIDTAETVVTQPSAGVFKGFSSICTHLQCELAGVDGGTINCNCHGSRFAITDGSVVNGPATQPLPQKRVVVAGGSIRLA